MLAMDFLAAGTSQAVQTTRVGLDMVLNIRPLPFHKRFVGFGQSLPQQFIHNITADALNSGDNALRRRLRTLAALTETDTTETCGRYPTLTGSLTRNINEAVAFTNS